MNISVHAEADLTAVAHNDLANAVRFLAVDAIETSQSGHPGLPMGMADVATVLFSRFLKFDSGAPQLAGSRPLRAVGGPRLDAALCAAASHRRRCQPRRHQGVPAMGLEDAGPSGIRPHAGCRDHDRTAGAGDRDRCRHGARRAHGQCAAWRRPGRSLHLCDRRRRLPDGRHQPGGDLARRSSPARPADRAVRRQRHLHRRADLAGDLG